MATALENNGAIVYIIGRRMADLEQAASEHNVRPFVHHQCPFPMADWCGPRRNIEI